MELTTITSKFLPGRFVITPGAIRAIEESGQEPYFFLQKHCRCDWGDVEEDDWRANDDGLRTGERLISSYKTLRGAKLWVITEAEGDDGKRASTTILLPEEY